MRFRSLLWWALLAGSSASGAPVAMDLARSTVEISVKSTIDSFAARLGEFEASVSTGPSADSIDSAVFRFHFASIKTGNADRDRDMNAWQQSSRFPDVVFTLTSLEPAPGAKSFARGRLVLHGVERTIGFTVSLAANAQTIIIDGEVPIDTRDYGLPVIRKYLVLKVDPIVRVHFHLQGKINSP